MSGPSNTVSHSVLLSMDVSKVQLVLPKSLERVRVASRRTGVVRTLKVTEQ